MNKSLKLRYVNQLVGSLFILVAILLVATIVLVARRQEWFVRTYHLRAMLPEQELDGLKRGSEIVLLGHSVGTVSQIRYSPQADLPGNQLLIELAIRENPDWPVFAGSVAHIRRHLAGAGEAYLEILRGTNQLQLLGEGDRIEIVAEKPPGDRLDEVVAAMKAIKGDFDTVRDAMVPAFQQFQVTTQHLDETNTNLARVVTDLGEFSPQLKPLADQAQSVLNSSQQAVEQIRRETDQLPGTVDKLQGGLDSAEDVLDGLRSHWLLRRFIDDPEHSETIAPAEVGRGDAWP